MKYLLDANVFVEAKNRYYGLDFCPAFWSWLEAAHTEKRVYSIEAIKKELAYGKDDLATWVGKHASLFLPPTAETESNVRRVAAWAAARGGVKDESKKRFLGGADPWLVAAAKAGGHTVVTLEKPAPESQKLKIPDACAHFEVPCIDPFRMLRHLGARFVYPGSS